MVGYSRWIEVYFIKNKSEVVSKFLEYKNYAETLTGQKLKVLHSDNGKEFCNAAMDEILKRFGIRRRLSTLYTPQQNGIAERKNRTLVESARCLLAESELPTSFWAEAIATANYIRNRCVTKILGKKTPHELWTRKRPNVQHLQKFGVKAYVLDKTPSKDKFAPRDIEGIFIVYSKTFKAYQVWISSERKVRVIRDVKFLNGSRINDDSPELRQSRKWRSITVTILILAPLYFRMNHGITIVIVYIMTSRNKMNVNRKIFLLLRRTALTAKLNAALKNLAKC